MHAKPRTRKARKPTRTAQPKPNTQARPALVPVPTQVLQRAIENPRADTLTPDVVRVLQRTHGNRFVSRLVQQAQQNGVQPIQRADEDEENQPRQGKWSRFKGAMSRGGRAVGKGIGAVGKGAMWAGGKIGKGAMWAGGKAVEGAQAVGKGAMWAGGKAVEGALWAGGKIGEGAQWAGGKIGDYITEQREKGRTAVAEWKSKITDFGLLALNGIKTGLITLLTEIGTVAAQLGSIVSNAIGMVLGTITSAINAARSWRAGKRQKIARRYQQMLGEEQAAEQLPAMDQQEEQEANQEAVDVQAAINNLADTLAGDAENGNLENQEENTEPKTDNGQLLEAIEYFGNKNQTKKWRALLASGGALVGAIGSGVWAGVSIAAVATGAVALGAGLTALIASNPVGWGIGAALVAAGMAVAVGYAIYKLAKAIYKWKKGTKGANRTRYANVLYNLARKGHRHTLDFLKEIKALREDDEPKKRFRKQGKFTMSELQDPAYKTAIVSYFMKKMQSN